MFTKNFYKNIDHAIRNYPRYTNKYSGAANNRMALDADASQKFYSLDKGGHIIFATTSKNSDAVPQDVTRVFQKVNIFLAALTEALDKKFKRVSDYDAVKSIVTNCGFFISIGIETRNFHSESTSRDLDITIIKDVLGDNITNDSVQIAKRELAITRNNIAANFDTNNSGKEMCHLLFVCDSIMGQPIVSASLMHTNTSQYDWVKTTNCGKPSEKPIDFKFTAEDYLFTDPDFINTFTNSFKDSPEFDDLVKKLAGYIH